jgi:hypothetical protein
VDAFSGRRLESGILDVLQGRAWLDPTEGELRIVKGEWVRPRVVALALAAEGFGPLEPLSRHVVPMLELLQLAGHVENLAAVGASAGSTYWRLAAAPVEGAA